MKNNSIISFDGIKLQIQQPDIDGNGITGDIEKVTQSIGQTGIQNIQQSTELGETLKELNDDQLTTDTGMSGIDLRSFLHPIENSSVLALDSLVAFNFLPQNTLQLSRQKKRLAVSLMGRGRDDIVKIAVGKREFDQQQENKGIMQKIGGWFRPKQQESM
jgi:hypothetical protein